MSRLFLANNVGWKLITNTETYGVALFSFTATEPHQISFSVGEVLQLEEESTNWYRGRVISSYSTSTVNETSSSSSSPATTTNNNNNNNNNNIRGIFPKSYVSIKNIQDFDIVTNELTQVIREWGGLLMKYYKERKMNEYKVMKERLSLLIEWHSIISSASSSTSVQSRDEVREIKGKVISKIEEGRRLMGLDMIVRTPNSEPASEKNTGIIQLYRMHHELDTLKYSKFTQQQIASSLLNSNSNSISNSIGNSNSNSNNSSCNNSMVSLPTSLSSNALSLSTSSSSGGAATASNAMNSNALGNSGGFNISNSSASGANNINNNNIPQLSHSLSGNSFNSLISSSSAQQSSALSSSSNNSLKKSTPFQNIKTGGAGSRKSISRNNTHGDGLSSQTSGGGTISSGSSSSGGGGINNNYQPNQIFLDLRVFMCAVGEETELYFSIYNKNEGRFISEEYQVGLTQLGMPHDIDKIGKLSTLFMDISKKEMQADLYLVVRLIRKGKMLVDSNKKAGTVQYRRPFGVSVLRLTEDRITVGKEIESIMTIYTSSQETSFSLLHEVAIKNPTSLQTVPKAKGICVALTLLPGDLNTVLQENPVLQDVQRTNKLGFPEVIFPGAVRNDIFITLECGEYSQDRKTSAKNVEILVQVRTEEGELLSNCLYYGDKLKSEYKSMVYYHTNQPHWSETFRINLPIFQIDKACLVFSIRHCTTSENKERAPFAMTYLKLTNPDGTVIANKTHSIPSYKTNKSIDEFLPSLKDPNNKNAIRKGEVTKVKVLLCSTMLTQNLSLLTLLKWDQYQGDLGEVLNRMDVETILRNITYVDQIEIIKFMQETFNALFCILEAKISDPDLVFNAITWIIGLLVDEKTSRYTNFRPVLDVYIENHFKSTVSHIHLIGALKRILTNDNFKTLITTLKSMEYILKFIVTSKKNHDNKLTSTTTNGTTNTTTTSTSTPTSTTTTTSNNNNNNNVISFKEDLTSVFNALSTLMKRTEGNYIGAQTTALKIFNSMFNDLGQLFSIEERGTIARNFVDSVRYDENFKLLNMEKMNVICNIVEGDLFIDSSSRALLVPMVKKHLKIHMISNSCSVEDTTKHAQVIAVMIEQIQTKIKDTSLIWEIVDLLPEIMKSIYASPWNDFSKLDMIHNMYSILYLMEPSHYDRYIQSTLGTANDQCWKFISNLLQLFNQLLSSGSTYPENWLTLSMFQYSTVKKVLIQFSKYLLEKLTTNDNNNNINSNGNKAPPLPPPRNQTSSTTPTPTVLVSNNWNNIDLCLWSSFFSLSTTYFKLKGLDFSETKQNSIKSRYGDMRNDLIPTVQKMWQSLDRHQIKLLPTVISPFLELMLINQTNIKKLGIELYYQLLKCEFKEYKSFIKVETETINTLDIITNSPEGSEILDEKFRKFFSQNLEEKMSSDLLIADHSKIFIRDMTIFLELLYQLRTLPDRPEYEDDRTIACMKLMSYLKQTDRQDTYTKYVHLLCNQHISNGNYVEAGNTLLLHADLLEWSDDPLEEYGEFKQQTKRERKERLYKQAIDYLDKGKAWEKAISLMKQLIIQYEEIQFDYQKLADILQQESTFYRKVINVERFFSEYFRVGYYGKGFDASIQGKEFIYKGYELERMSDFVQRIQAKFPSAKLLTYTELPPFEILDSNQQYLQIFSVKPISKEQLLLLNQPSSNNTTTAPASGITIINNSNHNNNNNNKNKKSISPALQKYRQNNNINTFVYSKPFKKVKTPKGGNEFKDLWIINNYYEVNDSFPTTHRRSEITRHFEVELSPIDNAVNSIIGKNVEIAEMISKHESGIDSNISPFTMVLKGVIDAAVNGGVNLYKEVFFSKEYIQENPDKQPTIDKLRAALHHQVQVLEKGLLVHSKVCSADMQGLQDQLSLLFTRMRNELDL